MKNRKDDIERYLRGDLSPAEMHALEKEALDDPFLAEALEGVEHAGRDNFLYDLHRLNRSVHERTRRRQSKPIRLWGWTAGIAATVLLVAASGFLVVSLLKDQQNEKLAMEAMEKERAHLLMQPKAEKDTLVIPLYKTAPQIATAPPEAKKEGGRAGLRAQPEIKVDDQPAAVIEATREPVLADAQQPDDLESEIATSEEQQTEVQKRAATTRAMTRASSAVAPTEVRVTGKVVSAEDGTALPAVNVTLKGTSKGAITDGEGNFTLTVPPSSTLTFAFIGFEPREVKVTDETSLKVSLQENVLALNEVVVVGYGSRSKAPTAHSAEPQDGRAGFKNYLEEAVRYPEDAVRNKIEGRVTVSFTVEADGTLKDFRILKGIGHGCDEALIQAIQNGPEWKPATSDGEPVADTVKVRYKFQLP